MLTQAVLLFVGQVTKSIVALLQHYRWNKFSIVAENSPRWQTVADSLDARVKDISSMTLNHRLMFEDMNRCCANRESCCHNSWTFDILEKTRSGTRSELFIPLSHSSRVLTQVELNLIRH